MAQFPVVPSDLLAALEKAFPDRAPRKPDVTPTEVGVLIGEQRVMDFLRRQHERSSILD